ncbi:eukaryotic translation initiation factor [Pelomyxa schiedti]|nr:eukaryotic translation initiation factor [Pelomyxa schiedti]
MWYDQVQLSGLVNASNWGDNLKRLLEFGHVEDFWGMYNHMHAPSLLPVNTNYHMFKTGIEPKWEDPSNENGGKWLLTLNKKVPKLDEMWLDVILACIGEQFEEGADFICGAVLTIKPKEDRIALWIKEADTEITLKIGRIFKAKLGLPDSMKVQFSKHTDAAKRGRNRGSYGSGLAFKVTKPEWLGDVVLHEGGLSAPAQFSSFALAVVSARCGSRSPARALGTHLLRQLWDDWVVGCQRAIVVDVLLKRKEDDGEERKTSFPMCAFRFSVSPLLLGIMGRMVAIPSAQIPAVDGAQWVDENRFIGVDGLTTERPEVLMFDALSGAKKMVIRREEGSISHLCANRSWLVNLKSGGELFVVTNMETVGVDPHGVAVVLPDPYSRATFLVLNKVITSQAVMLVVERTEGKNARSHFMVVDVAKTYSTRILNVVGTTPFPQHRKLHVSMVEAIVVTQNKVGENVFIISVVNDRRESVVMSVQSDGEIRRLCAQKKDILLRQVSGSQFSLYHKQRLDIWDCNDTTHRYPVIKCIPQHVDAPAFLVGGGLIVLIEKHHETLRFIDTSSMRVVVSFGINGWLITDLKTAHTDPTSPTRKTRRTHNDDGPPRHGIAPSTTTTAAMTEARQTTAIIIDVTKPGWLGDVAIHEGGLSAPAQFASLALGVVSARCGARSPARALGAHVQRQLWDDWVVGCQRVFVVGVELRTRGGPDGNTEVTHVCALKFGLSPMLLGIMGGGVKIVGFDDLPLFENAQWVDENRYFVDAGQPERSVVKLIDAFRGCQWLRGRKRGTSITCVQTGVGW